MAYLNRINFSREQRLNLESRGISTTPKEHWRFLDGMRGLAALMVVMFHIREEALKYLSPSWANSTFAMHYGHEAVCVFIVLSGFCLMIPISKSLQYSDPARRGALAGGVTEFVRRRARRILPAYYAAVFLSLTFNLYSKEFVTSLLHGGMNLEKVLALMPGLNWGVIFPHLLLINNYFDISPEVMPNYPLWSVALEWQIYFVFAILLLPLWRGKGIGWVLFAASFFSVVTFFAFPTRFCLWLVALFSMGMFTSDIAYDKIWERKKWNSHRLFGPLSVFMLLLGLVCKGYSESKNIPIGLLFSDIFVGASASALILFLINRSRVQERHVLDKVLSSRVFYFLGSMSYSIYLTHKMTLIKFGGLSAGIYARLSNEMVFLYNIVFGVPLVLIVAYCFYCVFERPFLNKRAAVAVQ
jgi:peptidoglycan/LPS O-acetylase OafA/YrhL